MSSPDTNPGVYPGNPSLPREVREKILSTFRHTLNLYKEGKIDDCLIGCDFILKMDARFVPAKKLLEKARNPSAEVDVAELEALVAGTLTRQERVVAAEPDRLLVRAVESYNARDFDAAAASAEQVLEVLPGNQDAVEILEKARRKKAAQPQVESAKQKAIAALGANDLAGARQELTRMKALDPDHPAVALLEAKLGLSAPPVAALATPPIGQPGHDFGQGTAEPQIDFDDHATMALRLDDLPPAVPPVKPPSDLSDTSPLRPAKRPPVAAPAPPPPSPVRPAPAPAALDSLDGLSLDSLSLDMPPSPSPATAAPASDGTPGPPPGSPADMWGAPTSPEVESIALSPEEPHPMPAGEPSFDLGSFDAPAAPEALAASELKPIQETESSHAEREIANLLKQGDEAAKRGEVQQAIEIWSRIFLIDINNSEAVIRIERSRQDMAEGNRKIADCLKTGREAFEAGDLAVAREMFLQVLAVDENEPTAKFYLDRIEEEMASPAPAKSASADGTASDTASEQAPPAREAAVPKRGLRLPFPPRVLVPIAIFLLLAVGGSWYFMRQPAPKSAQPTLAPTRAKIDDAATLVRDGKAQEAIEVLKGIKPTDPEYPRAKKMLDQLARQAAETPAVAAAVTPVPAAAAGIPATVAETTSAAAPLGPAQLRAAGEKALAEKRYIDALKNFNLALPAYRSDPSFSQSMGSAAEKVTEISPAVRLFNESEYETAIPVLWRILQEDRDNQDARSYLLRCYYNQGVSQLQNSLFSKAMKSFDEVLSIDSHDVEAQRHRRFAERYQKADLDLMGRIYVRHIPHRP